MIHVVSFFKFNFLLFQFKHRNNPTNVLYNFFHKNFAMSYIGVNYSSANSIDNSKNNLNNHLK